MATLNFTFASAADSSSCAGVGSPPEASGTPALWGCTSDSRVLHHKCCENTDTTVTLASYSSTVRCLNVVAEEQTRSHDLKQIQTVQPSVVMCCLHCVPGHSSGLIVGMEKSIEAAAIVSANSSSHNTTA